jgi:glycosyltransferase involved in cell wall biosynthesis
MKETRIDFGPVTSAARDAGAAEDDRLVVAVVPTYRARATINRVIARALDVVDIVIVVDDRCPERSGDFVEPSERVHVIRHEVNRGVGGAVKTGITAALNLGADVIVKIDSDDQMDVSYVPVMVEVLELYPEVDMVKGNRFADPSTLRTMPRARLIGNAGLTFLVKLSSGYWTITDPTNGFIAVRGDAIRRMDLAALADRYFFEIDLLCAFGLRRRVVCELEMPAIYAGETSSLSIPNVLLSFPPRLIVRFLRRLLVNYVLVEINVGTLCGLLGIPLLIFAVLFGGHEWYTSNATGVSRPTGTIVLALLLFMIGFQLSLQALLYDVQFSTRTVKLTPHRHGVGRAVRKPALR